MPKVVNHDDRRLELAAAAVEVIADKGIDNLRLVDVAKKVGATTGLVTHYLGDKESVLLAALEYVSAELIWREGVESVFSSIDEFVDFLCEILPLDEKRRREWTVWLAFWSRATVSDELRDTHQAYNQKFRAQVGSILDALGVAGDRQTLGNAVVTTIDGIAAHATIEPQYWTSQRQKQQLRTMLNAIFETILERG